MCLFLFSSPPFFTEFECEIFRMESEVVHQDAGHLEQGLVDGYVGELQYNDTFGFSFC